MNPLVAACRRGMADENLVGATTQQVADVAVLGVWTVLLLGGLAFGALVLAAGIIEYSGDKYGRVEDNY